MKEETAEQAAARRAADAKRKRENRLRVKQEKQAKTEAETFESYDQYWAAQRANLTESQRAEYEARESDVLDLEFAMKKYADGNYEQTTDRENRVLLEAIIEEVKEEVATHGLCESIILVVPKLWASGEKDLRERILAKGGATALLLQYGYRTALDGFLYERFYQKFMRPHSEAVQLFTTLTCMCGQTTSISVEVARLYTARLYRCQRCIDREASSRAVAMKSLAAEYRTPENTLYDDWGRIKDQ